MAPIGVTLIRDDAEAAYRGALIAGRKASIGEALGVFVVRVANPAPDSTLTSHSLSIQLTST